MSLDLDKRQRAMLREMGIRLWQPQPTTAEVADLVAPVGARKASVAMPTSTAVSAPGPETPTQANTMANSNSNSAWSLGEARALYVTPARPAADSGHPAAPGAAARWLLLTEAPTSANEVDPLAGDAGKLLDNMLRAAGLHQSASAVCVSLSRRLDPATAANTGNTAPLDAVLAGLFKAEKPDVVLIMGRLAAQALLQSTEPLGKLRGRAHQLAGVAAVVTYDAAYLLRSLPDKAKAWDDLCRAQHIAQQAGSAA